MCVNMRLRVRVCALCDFVKNNPGEKRAVKRFSEERNDDLHVCIAPFVYARAQYVYACVCICMHVYACVFMCIHVYACVCMCERKPSEREAVKRRG
jgi:hypothetical protein